VQVIANDIHSPQMFRPLFCVPLAIALVLLQQVPIFRKKLSFLEDLGKVDIQFLATIAGP